MGNLKNIKIEQKALKEAIEKEKAIRALMEARERMANSGQVSADVTCAPDRNIKRKSNLECYKEQLENIDQQKQTLMKIVDELEQFPYSRGDIVTHPELGNCLVQDLRAASEYHMNQWSLRNRESQEKPQHELYIQAAGYDYPQWVPLDKVVPFNRTSQTLYAKK